MNVPIQSHPVLRIRIPGAMHNAVVASGDGCPSNYWCCAQEGTGNHPSCYACNNILGVCGTPQDTFCQSLGLHPSDQC